MAAPFEPLDLTTVLNRGRENLSIKEGFVWPFIGKEPNSNGLADLPEGSSEFWGIPFHLVDRASDPTTNCFVIVADGVKGLSESVSIPAARSARRLLFAHCCGSAESGRMPLLEGVGETIGEYRVVYEDGTSEEQILRRRFEIHDLSVPWGHHPFLCRNCREFTSIPIHDRSVSYGPAQVGVMKASNDLGGWWIFGWENPHPERAIERIELTASGSTPIVLGAITLSDELGDPLHWPPREEVAISLPEDSGSEVSVSMQRGVIARQDDLHSGESHQA